ncbi:hypothetical protein HDU78_003225 [Chytriomyces hyalinus]|nr:hypothetical protein HDU78_003225 [Chytriomyces hyalinus]
MDSLFLGSRFAPAVREGMLKALHESLSTVDADTCAILLSGGLDTSVVADAVQAARVERVEGRKGAEEAEKAEGDTKQETLQNSVTSQGFKHAITVCVSTATSQTDAPWIDLPYAEAIVRKHAPTIKHHVLAVENPMDDLMKGDILEFCVRTLQSFDPMDLRGGVAVAHAIKYAQANGFKTIVTGDAADELFAGYSFLISLSDVKMRKWIKRYVGNYSFSAVPLGEACGIKVIQPFIHPAVIEAALKCNKSDLVGPDPTDPSLQHGKYVLRAAFPEATSRWRKKVPLETGCNTTPLGAEFEAGADLEWLKAQKAEVYSTYGIDLWGGMEHLHYFRVFEKIFAERLEAKSVVETTTLKTEDSNDAPAEQFAFPTPNVSWKTKSPRFGSDPCIKCGFQLDRKEQYFCRTCGAWPARHGGVPQDTEEED